MPIIHSMSDLMSNADFVGDWTQTDRLLYGAEIEVSKTTTSIAERCANVILLAANNPPNSAPNPIEGLTAYEVTNAESNFTLSTQTSTTRFTARVWSLLTCAISDGYAGNLPTLKLSASTDATFATQLDSPTMRRGVVNSWYYEPKLSDYNLLIVCKGSLRVGSYTTFDVNGTDIYGSPPPDKLTVGRLAAYMIRPFAYPDGAAFTNPYYALFYRVDEILKAEPVHIYAVPNAFTPNTIPEGVIAFNPRPASGEITDGALYTLAENQPFRGLEVNADPVYTPNGNGTTKTAPEVQMIYCGFVDQTPMEAGFILEYAIDPYNGTISINAGGDYMPTVLELPELFFFTQTTEQPDARDYLQALIPPASGVAVSLITKANPVGAIISGVGGLITGLPQEQVTEKEVGSFRTSYLQEIPFLVLQTIDYTANSVRTAELLESTEGLPSGGYTTLPPTATKAYYRGELHAFNPGITPSYPYYCPIGEFKNDLNTDFASGITFT